MKKSKQLVLLIKCFLKGSLPFIFLLGSIALAAQEDSFEQARQLAFAGQHDAASKALDALLAEYPDYLPAQLLQASNYAWSQHFKQSVAAFQHILAQDPQQADALIGLGYTYAWSGATAKAISTFQKALSSESRKLEALKGLGYAYLYGRQPEAAREVFGRLAEDQPDSPEFYNALGQAYLQENKLENARQFFEKALTLDPSNTDAQQLLENTYAMAPAWGVDLWGGFSAVDEENRLGLRLVQLSYQFNPRFLAYARYDNTLSLDNLDFVSRKNNVPSAWLGGMAGWNSRLATRLEYGARFLPDGGAQQLVRLEQVFYLKKDFNLHLGGYSGFAGDLPSEWVGFAALRLPISEAFSFEPAFYYGEDGAIRTRQQRFMLAGKLALPSKLELAIGGFYGTTNLELENTSQNIAGGYLLALFPLSKQLQGQLAVNHEEGVFASATVLALGLKFRFQP
ncbi:MAG: tetratricopeptide repeat protein [Phaeodactylibacter sp.]|nr:tetratricopeptide repeat protein [Phaeodactylibacter sp.]